MQTTSIMLTQGWAQSATVKPTSMVPRYVCADAALPLPCGHHRPPMSSAWPWTPHQTTVDCQSEIDVLQSPTATCHAGHTASSRCNGQLHPHGWCSLPCFPYQLRTSYHPRRSGKHQQQWRSHHQIRCSDHQPCCAHSSIRCASVCTAFTAAAAGLAAQQATAHR